MTARVMPVRRAQGTAPRTDNRKAMPRRQPNAELRTREYLTPDEVEQLQRAAASVGRHGHRDATLIMLAYRHGLRVSELVALRWDQIDLKAGALHVNRLKNGSPSVHPLRGPCVHYAGCSATIRQRPTYS